MDVWILVIMSIMYFQIDVSCDRDQL